MKTKNISKFILAITFFFSTTSFTNGLAPIHIASLYKYSVFVGVVKVIEGRHIENFGYKYKAEVLTCFKGDSTKYIEFGEYSGTSIGSEYLIFLSNKSENIRDTFIEIVDDSGKVIDTIPNHSNDIELAGVLYVRFAGFGQMPIKHSIETKCDAIKICTSHVLVPKKIKRYPYLLSSSNIWDEYYFKKVDIVNYLKLLQKTDKPPRKKAG